MPPDKSTVLIVDDQPENIHVLLQTLQEEYAVLAALDGEKALLLASRDNPPDAILLDVMMPGMDGYEVCRRLKENERTRDIPVLFVTTLHEAHDEAKGLALGAIDYITKPVNPDLVKARVANHIALRQAARLKEDVERLMRHDLRGPLGGIIGLPRMVLREATLSEEHAEMLRMVEKAGYRMLQMLNMSLDLYKMEQGLYTCEPETVNLVAVLRDVAAELAETAETYGAALSLQLDGKPLALAQGVETFYVLAETLLCHCMAANLVKNAIEASPRGGVVTLSLAVSPSDNHALFTVHNQGVVPQDIQGRFMEKYVTWGKERGTGLGAYSAKLMARTLGGDVSWSSSEAEGTSISVRLPLAETRPPRPRKEAAPRRNARSLRVLLVDDDFQTALLLKRQLQGLGHEVELAAHGQEALVRFTPGRFHLVLMDKEMPVMGGKEAAGGMRQLEREAGAAPTHLVALTGHEDPRVHEELLRAGFSHSLRKPLESGDLERVLEQVGAEGARVVCEVDADLEELLPGVLRALRRETAQMDGLLQAADWEALRAQGHKRKGTCRAYGLTPLVEAFRALEDAAKERDAEAVRTALGNLTSLLERFEPCYRCG